MEKGMPTGEESAYLLEHGFSKEECVRTCLILLQPFKHSDQMRPAELTDAIFMITPVGGVVVGADDTGKGLTQNFLEHLGPAGRGDEKKDTEACETKVQR